MPFPVSAAAQAKANAKRAPEISPVKRAAKRASAAAPPVVVASGDPAGTPASPGGERLERSASDQVRARAAPAHAVETPSSVGPGTPLNPTAAPNGGGMRTLQAPVSTLSPGDGVGTPVMATARRATGVPLRFRGGARSTSDSEEDGDGEPAPRRHPGKAPAVAVAAQRWGCWRAGWGAT
jgi:hypothetical protein